MAGAKSGARKPAKPKATKSARAAPKTTSRKAASSRPAAKPAKTTKPATGRATTAKRPAARPKARSSARTPAKQDFALNKLHQVALLATDLDAAIHFYQDVLGLPFVDRFDPPGLAFFNLGGGTRLLLSATASEATLYFSVEDIDKAVKMLTRRGVSFLQKPHMIHRDDEGKLGKKGVEEWMTFFRDPSGNLLALVMRR